jgi:hypothetical protein
MPQRVLGELENLKRAHMREYLELIVDHMGFKKGEERILGRPGDSTLLTRTELVLADTESALKRARIFGEEFQTPEERRSAMVEHQKRASKNNDPTTNGGKNNFDAFAPGLVWGEGHVEKVLRARKADVEAALAEVYSNPGDEKEMKKRVERLDYAVDTLKYALTFLAEKWRDNYHAFFILCDAKRRPPEDGNYEKWILQREQEYTNPGIDIGPLTNKAKDFRSAGIAFAIIRCLGFSSPFDTAQKSALNKNTPPALMKEIGKYMGQGGLGKHPMQEIKAALKKAGICLNSERTSHHAGVESKCTITLDQIYPAPGEHHEEWKRFWRDVGAKDDDF